MTPLDLFLYIVATLGGIGVSCVGSFALLIGLYIVSTALMLRERAEAEYEELDS